MDSGMQMVSVDALPVLCTGLTSVGSQDAVDHLKRLLAVGAAARNLAAIFKNIDTLMVASLPANPQLTQPV
jgi:hypothetical protein